MSKINVLTPLIANMIAAGEVLERPSSAVKELIENSIDAKATRIVIEIMDGGKTSIKVTDNGTGMEREDVKKAFLRHATSKISTQQDLEKILTLGFRGEALASICAVSKVEITTRTKDSIIGTRMIIEGGEIIDISDAGCSVGTSITIKGIFYNTPARMKFLKSEATENAYITDIIEKFIIVNPKISFKLIKNKKESLFSAGDNNFLSNITNIYSSQIANNLIYIDYHKENIDIVGYIGNEIILRANRKQQMFFVNDRIVKNKVFNLAIDEALKEKMIGSKYPFLILNIKIDCSMVDVNVHPTKAEIKFSDDKFVYTHLFNAIYEAYQIKGIDNKEEQIEETPLVFEPQSFIKETQPIIESSKQKKLNLFQNKEFKEVETPKFEAITPVLKEEHIKIESEKEKPEEVKYQAKETIIDFKIVGQIFETYIIIEKDNKMYLLDQHAAHERLIYDNLIKELEKNEIVTTGILTPFVFNLTPLEHATVVDNITLFKSIGFLVEDFGNNSIVVREIPYTLDDKVVLDTIIELCDIINNNKNTLLTKRQERGLYTIACKAAIKANKVLTQREITELVKNTLFNQSLNTCPHGRPLFISYDKYDIEKQFKRV